MTPCVYIYDPPLTTPLTGGDQKVGACGWSYIPIAAADQPATIRGTLNLASNALDLENLTVLLALNRRDPTTAMITSGFHGACAECVGDIKPNDGLKQGVCKLASHLAKDDLADKSPDLEMPCDVNRYGTDSVYAGGYSMDCSPTVDSVGQPLSLGGSFTSAGFQVSITDQSPNCTTPGSSGKCFCGMCSDGMTACMSNTDCSGGTCGWPATEPECDPNPLPLAPGYVPMLQFNQCKKDSNPRKFAVGPNLCVNDQCNWDPKTDLGSCASKLSNSNPPTMIRCYPSGSGATIIAAGRADRADNVSTIYLANTAGASCIPSGPNPALNSQLGLPGLLFQKRNFQIIPRYTEDQK